MHSTDSVIGSGSVNFWLRIRLLNYQICNSEVICAMVYVMSCGVLVGCVPVLLCPVPRVVALSHAGFYL